MNFFYGWFQIIVAEPWWFWGFLMSFLAFFLMLALRLYVWISLQKTVLNAWKGRSEKFLKIKTKSFYTPVLIIFLGSLIWLWYGTILSLLLSGLSGIGLYAWWNKQSQSRHQKKINQQLPLFLRALGSTLKAGYSVPQALVFVAQEVENPLKHELSFGAKSLAWQQPLEAVLPDWKKRVGVPEFNFLVDSLILQSRTGGNLVELCHRVAYLVEERAKLERDIQSFTAQGKMSGLLMAGLWPISLALFAWLSPSHTEILFYTLQGQFLLGVSFFLELLGFYCMWRLVRLKI